MTLKDSNDQKREFGAWIAELRKTAGLSRQQMSDITRIMPNYIAALEDGEFDKLPARVYSRGFLKNIARVVGVAEEEILSRFESASKSLEEATPKEQKVEKETPAQRPAAIVNPELAKQAAAKAVDISARLQKAAFLPSKNLVALGIATLSALTIVAWWANRSRESLVELEPKTTQSADSSPLETTQNTDQNQPLPQAPQLEQASESATAAGDEVTLEVTVTTPVRIKTSFDGQPWAVQEYQPQTYTFPFNDKASFLIYDASAVEIKFNGRDIGPLGNKGRMRRISFVKDKLENNQSSDHSG